jgi:hypothetical protein
MRIAVLVYGRLNACAEHHANIVESLGQPVDFFLSSDNAPAPFLQSFLRLYNPIAYTNAPIHYDADLGRYPGKRHETVIDSMTRHFINKNRVVSLLEKSSIPYDCVVSLRVDSFFNEKFNFDDLRDNTIYIPHGCDFVSHAINDQLAYGKMDVMKKYNSINPILLLERKLSIPHPESLTYANIVYHQLKVQRVPLNYVLIRRL